MTFLKSFQRGLIGWTVWPLESVKVDYFLMTFFVHSFVQSSITRLFAPFLECFIRQWIANEMSFLTVSQFEWIG